MRSFRTTPAALRAVVALLVAAAVLVPSVAAGAVGVAAAARAGVPVGGPCRLADPRIDEASGIAPGLASPGVGRVHFMLPASPVVITLPDQQEGEGIAFDGSRLLLDSEGTGTAVLSVGAPRALGAAASASAATSPPSPVRSSSGASKPGTAPSGSSSPGGSYGGGGSWVPGIVVLSLFVLGAIGWWVAQRGGDGRRVER